MPSKGARIGYGRLKGRSKYNAVKTDVDGIRFDSRAEARRYQELRCMERIGEIQSLYRQPSYDLQTFSGAVVGRYVADLSYTYSATGEIIVEDVKGFKTPLYRWKKKHVEAQYGITIREIR